MVLLNQVGLVHEGMRFPLWLHGRTIITFLVVSTFPKNHIGTTIDNNLQTTVSFSSSLSGLFFVNSTLFIYYHPCNLCPVSLLVDMVCEI